MRRDGRQIVASECAPRGGMRRATSPAAIHLSGGLRGATIPSRVRGLRADLLARGHSGGLERLPSGPIRVPGLRRRMNSSNDPNTASSAGVARPFAIGTRMVIAGTF